MLVCRIQEGDAQLFRLDAFCTRLKMTNSQLDRLCSRRKLCAFSPYLQHQHFLICIFSPFLFKPKTLNSPEKKLARKYSGQHALPKRNSACTSHLRANLILSLWKNWGLSRHRLGNSWIGEWSQRRRKTAQFYSPAMQTDLVCASHPRTVCHRYSEGPFT